MIPTSRIIYTQYKRRQTAKDTYPIACNAINQNEFINYQPMDQDPPSYDFADEKVNTTITTTTSNWSPNSSATDPTHSNKKPLLPLSAPIAILPQHITQQATDLTITRHRFSNPLTPFTVTDSQSGTPVLTISHSRPSLNPRLTIHDVQTGTALLNFNRRANHRPVSHVLSDPQGTRVGEVQGNFALPLSEAKRATAVFTNACDGVRMRLAVHGGWRGRPAEVKVEETGQVLALINGHGFGLVRLVGAARIYEVRIAAGVDVVFVVALVAALDARAD